MNRHIKTWQERTGNHRWRQGTEKHAIAEILDLRARIVELESAPADAAVAAIQFVLTNNDSDGNNMAFLRLWNEGDFDSLRKHWPEAPESVYIGADPLYEPKSAA